MKMHWCTCRVNLSGQNLTHVSFSPQDAVSWPEVQVLTALHGEENIYDIKPISIAEINSRIEKDRLIAKYGMIVERVFPGRAFLMETLMPAHSENLPLSDRDGIPLAEQVAATGNGNGNGDHPGDDDEEEDDAPAPEQPPSPAPAAFKPGKHPRPTLPTPA
jgi:hypothetical protein